MFDMTKLSEGYHTGLNSPTMREMPADELIKMAVGHLKSIPFTSHDQGMANACLMLAYKKQGGKGCEQICPVL